MTGEKGWHQRTSEVWREKKGDGRVSEGQQVERKVTGDRRGSVAGEGALLTPGIC